MDAEIAPRLLHCASLVPGRATGTGSDRPLDEADVVPNGQKVRLVAILAVAWAVAAVGGAADASNRVAGLTIRSCGTLSIGIGWHVAATRNVTCSSARQLMATYFRTRNNRQVRAIVYHYVCIRKDPPDAEHIRCSKADRLVTARSFGY
jgi:hypothetical protein